MTIDCKNKPHSKTRMYGRALHWKSNVLTQMGVDGYFRMMSRIIVEDIWCWKQRHDMSWVWKSKRWIEHVCSIFQWKYSMYFFAGPLKHCLLELVKLSQPNNITKYVFICRKQRVSVHNSNYRLVTKLYWNCCAVNLLTRKSKAVDLTETDLIVL